MSIIHPYRICEQVFEDIMGGKMVRAAQKLRNLGDGVEVLEIMEFQKDR